MVSLFMSCSPPQRKIIFIFAALTALMITIILNVTGKPLITPEAPAGIVSFELAGTISQAQIILDSWDGQAKLFAAFSLGFDYLYMVAYAVAIGLGCVLASLVIGERGWPFGGLGAPLAVCLWVAAGFDALENLALSVVLLGGATAEAWPALARICALVKFSLILIGLVYLIYGLIGWLAGRQTR
ncbi:MAG: hypothetical protein A2W35_10910 [Chloroflexi bacterium RBG_16_57_11]|nr:MAG: hypothetical protein A2W35_10910 [Chloroflexi bacterium RBG_16_57_11]